MEKFSERIGVNKPPKNLQIGFISDELRNSLWNLLYEVYESKSSHIMYWCRVAQHIAKYFRKVPIDEIPFEDYGCRKWVKGYFLSLSWDRLYDLIEFIVRDHEFVTQIPLGYSPGYHHHRINKDKFIELINFFLVEELSGYRFISGVLSPISNQTEIDAIEQAMAAAKDKGLQGCHIHLRTALEHLGKKPKPDYRNSIKESISAVESIVKQISQSSSQGVEDALKELSKKTDIHGALKSGFIKLYGYTSDEDGIRHAILDQADVGFAEAKYMIVSCSAFVHYLIEKANTAGLLERK